MRAGIETVPGEIAFLLLEGLGQGQRWHQAQKKRPGIGGQARLQMRIEALKIEMGVGFQRRHARLAVRAGHRARHRRWR